LASLGESGEGGENDEELAGMLEGMMAQLMSKEILYEPLKELGDKVCVLLLRFDVDLERLF
jgi:peroxin-19